MIGNDIVDLNEIHTPHARFINRVFTPDEKNFIEKNQNQRLIFWAIWSAKEAAYKALVRYSGQRPFEHKKIKVLSIEQKIDSKILNLLQKKTVKHSYTEIKHGIIHYDELPNEEFYFLTFFHKKFIHTIAIIKKNFNFNSLFFSVEKISHFNFKNNFSDIEKKSIHSEQSSGVRQHAKKLLRKLGIKEKVEIIRFPSLPDSSATFLPPEIFSSGKHLNDLSLTLSHDGAWSAVALQTKVAHNSVLCHISPLFTE